MASADLSVFITGSGSQLVNEFKKVASAANETSAATTSSWDKAKKGIQVAGLAIAGAAVAIGVASVKSADTFDIAHARMQAAIKATHGSFGALSPKIDATDSAMRKFGITDGDTEAAIARLTLATHSTNDALNLMSLAANIAAGRHIDLSAATDILAKVETGHVALLGRLGIATKDATGKTISQQQAIAELTSMFAGQASAAASTFAGKQQVLKAQLEHVEVSIGHALIPIIEKLIAITAKVVDWLTRHRAVAIALAVVIGGVLLAATVAWTASLFAADGALAFLISPITLVVAAVAALAAGVIYAYNHFSWFKTIIDDVGLVLKTVFLYTLRLVKDEFQALSDAASWVWSHISSAISTAAGIIQSVLAPVISMFETMWDIASKVVGAVSSIGGSGTHLAGAGSSTQTARGRNSGLFGSGVLPKILQGVGGVDLSQLNRAQRRQAARTGNGQR